MPPSKRPPRYLEIHDWDHHQSETTTEWFRVWTRLFSLPKWNRLSMAERGLLVSLWGYQAKTRASPPCAPLELRACLGQAYTKHTLGQVQRLVDVGFLHFRTHQRRVDKRRKEKSISGVAPRRAVSPSLAARELVQNHEKTSGHTATEATFRSVQKLLDAGKGDDLRKACLNYKATVETEDTDIQYRIRPHNFFGREAKWQLYINPAGGNGAGLGLPDDPKRAWEAKEKRERASRRARTT